MSLAPVLVPSLRPLPPHLLSKDMRRRGKKCKRIENEPEKEGRGQQFIIVTKEELQEMG